MNFSDLKLIKMCVKIWKCSGNLRRIQICTVMGKCVFFGIVQSNLVPRSAPFCNLTLKLVEIYHFSLPVAAKICLVTPETLTKWCLCVSLHSLLLTCGFNKMVFVMTMAVKMMMLAMMTS